MMNKQFDILIAGSGIIGTSIAFALSKKGYRILVVDPLAGAGQGSTSSSLAMIRTQYSSRETTALAWEGFQCWKNWANYLGPISDEPIAPFYESGVLTFKTSNNRFLEPQLRASLDLGIPFKILKKKELEDYFPDWEFYNFGPPVQTEDPNFGKKLGDNLEAVFFPYGGYCSDPRLATNNLKIASEREGATFRFRCSVKSIKIERNRVVGVDLSDGSYLPCNIVVNACGPHSQSLNLMAGLNKAHKINTRVLRHEAAQVFYVGGVKSTVSPVMLYDTDTGSYARNDTLNHILVGGLGAKNDVEIIENPDDFNRSLSAEALDPILRLAQRIPEIGIPNNLPGLADLWDVSDDWIPIYDCTDIRGFFLATGTSGNQFKTAPVVGELIAELIGKVEAGIDHDLSPINFRLPRTGHTINLGFFSRNRRPNLASSLSVLG